MPKIKIKATIANASGTFEYNVPAIYKEDENIILYKENDEQKTTVSFNYKTKELIRENASLIMIYPFNKHKNAQGTIHVKGMERTFHVVIKTTKLIRHDKNIDIEYHIGKDKFIYKIEVI